MNKQNINVQNYGLEEISKKEQRSLNGGVAGLAAIAIGVGCTAGGLLIGAAVGYGIYKLVKWISN